MRRGFGCFPRRGDCHRAPTLGTTAVLQYCCSPEQSKQPKFPHSSPRAASCNVCVLSEGSWKVSDGGLPLLWAMMEPIPHQPEQPPDSVDDEVVISVDVVCPARLARQGFAVAPFPVRVPATSLLSLKSLFSALQDGALVDEMEASDETEQDCE